MSLQKAFVTVFPYATVTAPYIISSEIDVSTAFSACLAVRYSGTIQDGYTGASPYYGTVYPKPLLQIESKFDVAGAGWVSTWTWILSATSLAAGTIQATTSVAAGSISSIISTTMPRASTPGWAYINDQRVWVSTYVGADTYYFAPAVTVPAGKPIIDGSQTRRMFLLDTTTIKAIRLVLSNIVTPPPTTGPYLLGFSFGATALLANNVY